MRGEERATGLRVQAVKICSAIMEELVHALPLDEGEVVSGGDMGPLGLVEGEEGEKEEEEGEEEGEGEGEEEEEEVVEMVRDEERVEDRKARLRIYIGVLSLACAMVCTL